MASGRINGTVTGTSASKYNYWVEWNSTPYPKNNYSLVNATAYLQRNNGYAGSAYNLNIPVDNKIIKIENTTNKSDKKGIDTRNSAKVVIASIKNLKIAHDKNGQVLY